MFSTRNKKKIEAISKRINKNFRCKLFFFQIYEILYLLKEPLGFWEIVGKTDILIPVLVDLLEDLLKEDFIFYKEDKFGLRLVLPQKKVKKYYHSERLSQAPIYSQLNLSATALIERVNYLLRYCEPLSEICFLGDDDFVSLSLASSRYFKRIQVIDIDKRIVDKINTISAKEKYDLKAICYDLTNPLGELKLEKFDTVLTDPPYSVNGFSLFVARAIEILNDKNYSQLFVSFSPEIPILSIEKEVQEIICDLDLYLYQKINSVSHNIPLFLKSKYPSILEISKKLNSEMAGINKWLLLSLGRRESLFHFIVPPNTQPLFKTKFKGKLHETL